MKRRNVLIASAAISLLAGFGPVAAQNPTYQNDRAVGHRTNHVSPAHQVEPFNHDHRHGRHDHHDRPEQGPFEVRSIDGSGNNPDDVEHNATHHALARVVSADYADGVASLAGTDRPSARDVSNTVHRQEKLIRNRFGTSDYLWQWGQFLDHDIDLTEGTEPPEYADIPVAAGDPHFDPGGTGTVFIPFNRSIYDPETGTDAANPREQINEITAWIDGSNVYGSDAIRAAALRANDGTGRLATSRGGLLPESDGTLPNATGGSNQVLFLAGDIRANEQLGLTALHTLFVREHNRLADEIRASDSSLDDDAIYERARRIVGALMQVITYEEFLPALLGPGAIGPYRGYDPTVDARIANEFSTAAYRFGHSALPPRLLRLDRNLREIAEGHLALRDAFFNPDRIRNEGGIEPFLRGLAHQRHQRIDVYVIDDVRNFLFGPPGSGGFDLASLNIQRGRDHGLASYNDAREAYGIERATDFSDVTKDPEVLARLAAAYQTVDEVDLWVGCLAEGAASRAQVGPLVRSILVEQFTALRDGDRFWYENALDRRTRDRIRRTRLSDIIRRNTEIGSEIPDDVFRIAAKNGPRPRRAHDRARHR